MAACPANRNNGRAANPPAQPRSGALQDMTLQLRLSLTTACFLLAALLAGAAVMVGNAREDIRAEVDSTARLATRLLESEIRYLADCRDCPREASPFRLNQLAHLRHLRIAFVDPAGRTLDSNDAPGERYGSQAPHWFATLLAGHDGSGLGMMREVTLPGRPPGMLVITPDPSYEIAEIWHDTSGVMATTMLIFLALMLAIHFTVVHSLRPVVLIRDGLLELGRGNLSMRLPRIRLPELDVIAAQFNLLGGQLQDSQRRNRSLTSQLIALQEAERKALARDLHDDLSQCLTGIQIEAATLRGIGGNGGVADGAAAILSGVQRMRAAIRIILCNLRPGSLDEFGLVVAVAEMCDAWRAQNPATTLECTLEQGLPQLPEVTAVTAYRVIQEGLNNVSRHASAHRVRLALGRVHGWLAIDLQDDGRGFAATALPEGFGLRGMRERIEGLGGGLRVASEPGAGVRLHAELPMDEGAEWQAAFA